MSGLTSPLHKTTLIVLSNWLFPYNGTSNIQSRPHADGVVVGRGKRFFIIGKFSCELLSRGESSVPPRSLHFLAKADIHTLHKLVSRDEIGYHELR